MTSSAGKQNPYGRQKFQSPSTPNAIWSHGKLEGFRCYDCGKIDQSMCGDTCYECLNLEDHNTTLTEAVKEFTEVYEATVKA